MPMPTSANGGTWLSGDTIGKGAMNLKTILNIPSTTYLPVIGTDTVAGQLYIDPVTGLRRVMNSANTYWNTGPLGYLNHDPNGFPVNTTGSPNPSNQTTISFTNTSPTRTFSIAPTGASFSIYVNGTEYTFTTAQTVQITNTEGLWYFYFNSSGVLTASQSFWSLEYDAVVAYVYWDATNTVCSYFADERHCFAMDWRTHYYLHNSIGTRYVSGLAISGYTLNTSGDTNVQIGISNGTVFDEDLEFDIANGSSGTPASTPNFYNQPLTKPATIPVYYQVGATGVWRKTTTANWYIYPDVNSRPYYNLNTAGTWSLADVPSGDVVSYWIFATNDIDNPIIAIMGQQINTSLTNAQTNDLFSALSISSGLPFLEMKLLYQIILSVLNSYGGTTKSRVSVVNDFRTSSIGGSGQNATGYISSVGLGFSVAAGLLSLNSSLWSIDGSGNLTTNGDVIIDNGSTPFTLHYSHLQNVGSGDSPTFVNANLTGILEQNSLPYPFKQDSLYGLLLYLPMNEGTGITAYDLSGNGLNGTLNGSPSWVAGKFGKGLFFTGTNNVSLGDGITALSTANISVCLWFNATSTNTNMRMFSNSNYGYYLMMSAGTVIFTFYNSSAGTHSAISPLTYNDGLWHFAVGNYDGANVNIYVDGLLVAQTPTTDAIYYSQERLRVGAQNDTFSQPYVGSIDEVRVYNRALSATEVLSIYQNGELPIPETLINQSLSITSSPTFAGLIIQGANYFAITSGGYMEWGGGASYDVELSRTGIGVLTVNGSLTVSSTLTVTGGMAGTHGQNIGTGDSPTFSQLTLNGSSDQLTINSSGTASEVIESTGNSQVQLVLYRNQPSGSYNFTWYNFVQASQTTLKWNYSASTMMSLDSSGSLITTANITCGGGSSAGTGLTVNAGRIRVVNPEVYQIGIRYSTTDPATWFGSLQTSGTLQISKDNGVSIVTIDQTGNIIAGGVITGSGWVNSSPAYTNSNPWFGTPTTARALNTVYYNATGKTLVVSIRVDISANVNPSIYYFYVVIGSTSTPTNLLGFFNNGSLNQAFGYTFIVPSGWYYEIVSTVACTLNNWAEQYL